MEFLVRVLILLFATEGVKYINPQLAESVEGLLEEGNGDAEVVGKAPI
jgi:hypothetical protein